MTRKKDSLTETKPIWAVSAIAVLLLRDVDREREEKRREGQDHDERTGRNMELTD